MYIIRTGKFKGSKYVLDKIWAFKNFNAFVCWLREFLPEVPENVTYAELKGQIEALVHAYRRKLPADVAFRVSFDVDGYEYKAEDS